MHGRATQCKHTHYSTVLSKWGKGRQPNTYALMTGIPRFSRSMWAENITNLCLPYTNIWKGAIILIQGRESTTPRNQFSSILHAHVKNNVPKCSQFLHELHYLTFFPTV